MSDTNQNNQQQEDSGKIERNFNAALQKVSAILQGKQNLRPKKKASEAIIVSIVAELTKEREEKTRATVKEELGGLLTKYIEFEDMVKQKEEELKQSKEKKQKEFTEAANKFLNKVEGVDSFVKRMETILADAAGTKQ